MVGILPENGMPPALVADGRRSCRVKRFAVSAAFGMSPLVIPRLSKVLSQCQHRFREKDFAIRCGSCAQERTLSHCKTRSTMGVRTYRCPECAELLVTIGYPSERDVHREENPSATWWSVHPASDLLVQLKKTRLTIPPAQMGRIFGEPLL